MSSKNAPKTNSKPEKTRNVYYFAGLGMSFGLELAITATLGWFLGSFLDEKLGLTPLFSLIGLFLFLSFALAHIIRLYKRSQSDKE